MINIMKFKARIISRNNSQAKITHNDNIDFKNYLQIKSFKQKSQCANADFNKNSFRSSSLGDNKALKRYFELRKRKKMNLSNTSNNNSLSLIGSKNEIDMNKLCLPEETHRTIESKRDMIDYQLFKNEYLLKNFKLDEQIYKLKQKCQSVFPLETESELEEIYSQLKKFRQLENMILFTNFSVSICDVFYWKSIVSVNCELISVLIKLIDLLSIESQKAHDKLKQVPKLQLMTYNSTQRRRSSLTDIQKANVSQIKAMKKANEEMIHQIKAKHIKKEGQYLIDMHYFEEEIKELTHLLDKSKEYSEKYIEIKEEMTHQSRETEGICLNWKSQITDMTMKMTAMNQKVESFKEILIKLQTEKEGIKGKISELKQEIFDNKLLIRRLKDIIQEKNENIGMLFEEKEAWYWKYIKERKVSGIFQQSLFALEQRIKRDIKGL